jgi:hypothetical protein
MIVFMIDCCNMTKRRHGKKMRESFAAGVNKPFLLVLLVTHRIQQKVRCTYKCFAVVSLSISVVIAKMDSA